MIGFLKISKQIALLLVSKASGKLAADFFRLIFHILCNNKYSLYIPKLIFLFKYILIFFLFLKQFLLSEFIFSFFFLQYFRLFSKCRLIPDTGLSLSRKFSKPFYTMIQSFFDFFIICQFQLLLNGRKKPFHFSDFQTDPIEFVTNIIQIKLQFFQIVSLAHDIPETILILAMRNLKLGKNFFISVQCQKSLCKQIQSWRKITFSTDLPYPDAYLIQCFSFFFCQFLMLPESFIRSF